MLALRLWSKNTGGIILSVEKILNFISDNDKVIIGIMALWVAVYFIGYEIGQTVYNIF